MPSCRHPGATGTNAAGTNASRLITVPTAFYLPQVQTPDFAPSSEAGSRALDQLLAAKRAKRALCNGERQPPEALLTPPENSSAAIQR
jgi:hypothetical protein